MNEHERILEKRKRLLALARRKREQLREGQSGDQDIAIIGVAGRYPQARNVSEFWDNLRSGRNCISEVPADRWDWRDYYDPDSRQADKTNSRWGGFISNHDKFDPLFFKISPREAECMDPQERLFLENTWHLFEDAGITNEDLVAINSKVGVYVGVSNAHYAGLSIAALLRGHPNGGNSSAWSIPNRISYFWDLKGPSMAVDTACSSSLTAIHLACEGIRSGSCHMAIAGGVSLILSPTHFNCLSQVKMLSPDGLCKVFGKGANGFVDGEGLGSVLLRPLADAIAAGDQVYGVIRGSSINSGGRTSGFTVPNPNAQGSLIEDVLTSAQLSPDTISYVEAHGTGTALGDPIEIAGLTRAFRQQTDRTEYCAIGSVKSNIGHLEAAAGIAGLTKILMMMKHRKQVPSLHAEVQNPEVRLEGSPFYLNHDFGEWKPDGDGILRAGLSSFGAGGANVHLIVDSYVAAHSVKETAGSVLLVFSANNQEALQRQVAGFAAYLEGASSTSLDALSYTLQCRREALKIRCALVADTIEEAIERMLAVASGQITNREIWLSSPVQAERFLQSRFKNSESLKQYAARAFRELDWWALGQLWIDGEAIPWRDLYPGSQPFLQTLPPYSFALDSYWMDGAAPAAGDLLPDDAINRNVPELVPAPELAPDMEGPPQFVGHILDPFEVVRDSLVKICSAMTKMERSMVDCDEPLISYGFDSIMLYYFIDGVLETFGVELPVSSLQTEPTLNSITALLLKEHPDEVRFYVENVTSDAPESEDSEVSECSEQVDEEDIEGFLAKHCALILKVDSMQVDRDESLDLYGCDSVSFRFLMNIVNEELGVKLLLKEFFEHGNIRAIAKLIKSRLGEKRVDDRVISSPEGASATEVSFPLSQAQQWHWSLNQMIPDADSLLSIPMSFLIEGRMDSSLLREALLKLVERHPALRTVFHEEEGVPQQHVLPELAIDFIHRQSVGESSLEEEILSWNKSSMAEAFDLYGGPLVKVRLLSEGDDRHVLFFIFHHLVSDLWSIGIFIREMIAYYHGLETTTPVKLATSTLSYRDFVEYESAWSQSDGERIREFWHEKFSRVESIYLDISDHDTGNVFQNPVASSQTFRFKEGLSERVVAVAKSMKTAPFTVLSGAFQLLFYTLTENRDIITGLPYLNRVRPGYERIMGFFSNVAIIYNQIDETSTVLDYIKQTEVALSDAEDYALPFIEMLSMLRQREAVMERAPVQVCFTKAGRNDDPLGLPGRRSKGLRAGRKHLVFDCFATVLEEDGAYEIMLEYLEDSFDRETIRDWFDRYEAILEFFCDHSGSSLSEVFELSKVKRRPRVHVAASFSIDRLESSLDAWRHCADFNPIISKADYGEFQSSLLAHRPLLELDKLADSVILFRVEDWLLSYDLSEIEESVEDFCERGRRGATEFTALLEQQVKNDERPCRIFLCPNSKRVIEFEGWHEIFCFWVEALEALAALVPHFNCVVLAGHDGRELDELSDRQAHVPYHENYSLALVGNILANCVVGQVSSYKVLAVDCDHTLWHGVLGEDGVDGINCAGPYAAFQSLLVEFEAAGFLICLCSKNESADVDAVFEQRSEDLALSREHIVTQRINWQDKSDNLDDIAEELNLGLASFVFIDDNPLEVAEVSARFPEVLALRFPVDVTEIEIFIDQLRLLLPTNTTEEDTQRTRRYCENRQRVELEHSVVSRSAYLTELALKVEVSPLCDEMIERVVQLSFRTNQFNLNLHRLEAIDIETYLLSETAVVETARVKDRFGDYGMTALLAGRVVDKLFVVDNFLASCRVLNRGVEIELLHSVGKRLKKQGVSQCRFTYIFGPRNKPMQVFLERVFADYRTVTSNGIEFLVPTAHLLELDIDEVEGTLIEASPTANASKNPAAFSTKSVLVERFLNLNYPDLSTGGRAILAATADVYEKPVGEVETKLAQIVQEQLSLEKVGRSDHYFRLGGNSILALQLVSQIRDQFAVTLPLDIVFTAPSVKDLAQQIENKNPVDRQRFEIEATGRKEGPLSFAQERLWYLEALHPNALQESICALFDCEGSLNESVLETALKMMIASTPSLRTRFVEEGGVVTQVCADHADFQLQRYEVEMGSELEDAKREGLSLLQKVALEKWDLGGNKSLMSVHRVHYGPSRFLVLFRFHHMIGDGWSLGLFFPQLYTAYQALLDGKLSEIFSSSISYVDYALWQRRCLESEGGQVALGYWVERLKGGNPVLDLPTDYIRPTTPTGKGDTVSLAIEGELLSQLRECASEQLVTVPVLLMSSLYLLLNQYSGEDDICVGMPVANRPTSEMELMFGFFANTLALRLNPKREVQTGEALVKSVSEVMREAQRHQEIPFEAVVQAASPERSLQVNPLFQVMLAYQNAGDFEWNMEGVRGNFVPFERGQAQFDLTFDCIEFCESLSVSLEYSTELFSRATAELLVQGLVKIVNVLVRNVGLDLASISRCLLAPEQVAKPSPSELVFEPEWTQLWTRWSRMTESALHEGSEDLSYRDLSMRVDQAALWLSQQSITAGDRVAVLMERSLIQVVAMLAIYRLGAIYCPIDTRNPEERLSYILDDLSPAFCLFTQEKDREGLLIMTCPSDCLPAYVPDLDVAISTAAVVPLAEDIAYIIYTSGSTGKPKGVEISYRALLLHAKSIEQAYGLGAGDRALYFSSPSFDIHIEETFATLFSGAELVVFNDTEALVPIAFADFVEANSVTVLNLPTAYWHELVQDPELKGRMPVGLRLLITGGEEPSAEWLHVWQQENPDVKWINAYGPTEVTITSVLAYVDGALPDGQRVPIGKPLPHVESLVVDDHLRPVMFGARGELLLGGDALAKGYRNQPRLTEKAFIVCNNAEGMPTRFYRTGDQVRQLASGDLEFLGRLDDQVKLRGYRIEVGEIEAYLTREAYLLNATVVLQEQRDGKRLVAFVQRCRGCEDTVETIRTRLQAALPGYMVPDVIQVVDSMPMTVTGKIDKQRLLAELSSNQRLARDADVMTNTELRVHAIWRELLPGVECELDDAFFEVGGHSLLLLRLVSALKHGFGAEVPLSVVYQNTTIRTLARYFDGGDQRIGDCLLPLSLGSAETNIYLVHGADGLASIFQPLVAKLPETLSAYGLQAPWLEGSDINAYKSLEALAAKYCKRIIEESSIGPLILGGWSMGGVLAFEMALQFSRQSLRPKCLVLIDSFLPDDVSKFEKLQAAAGLSIGPEISEDPLLRQSYEKNKSLFDAYVPSGKITCNVLYLRARSGLDSKLADAIQENWQKHVEGDFEVKVLDGDHYSLLESGDLRGCVHSLEKMVSLEKSTIGVTLS